MMGNPDSTTISTSFNDYTTPLYNGKIMSKLVHPKVFITHNMHTNNTE